MNKSQKNNNPVNLRYAKQTEASGKDDQGFAIFPTPSSGWRAAHAQISLDQSRGLTLKEFIFKFAPPNENDTNEYLEFVKRNVNPIELNANIPIKFLSKYALVGVMAQMEGYYNK